MKEKWVTLETKYKVPFYAKDTYYMCFDNVTYVDEMITTSKKLYEQFEEGYKYYIQYKPCNKPFQSKTAGIILSMTNVKILKKEEIK